jgi:outer membrane protein TolC
MSTTHVHSTDQQFNGAVAYLGRERDFKLGELTQSSDRFERAVIRRKDSQRYGRVLSELAPEATFDQVMGPLQKASEQWGLKPGERIEFGGDAEGAGEANASIFKVVPIAMLMLLIFLLIQFQSFGKLAVAFLALPVTVLGAFPGLLIGGAPFGFMSLLGILALVGIAINNIILLLEAMDETSDLRSAIERRFRPIFLSTSLTFLGLFPLALEGGTLWPPLAWTLISGLVTGTFATLVLVPGLIRVLQRLKFRASGSATLALLMVGVSSSWAQPSISLEQIMDLSDQTAEAQASKALLLSAQEELSRANRAAFFPSLTLGGETWMRDQTLTSSTPFGNLLQEKKQRSDFKLELRQPLLNLAQMVYARAAERLALDSAQLRHAHTVGALRFSVGAHALETLILGHQIRFAQESVRLLDLQTQDLERLLDRGRVRSTELIRLRHESQKARQSLQDLQSKQLQSRVHLERRLGIGLTLPISAPFEASPAPLVGPERPEPLDVRAQQTTAESTLARSALARAAYVPEVDLFVRGVSSQGTTLAETRWGEAGVTLRWELWGQGVRSSQARSALLQAEAQSQSARAFADQRQREIAESRETWARKLTFLKEVTKLLRMAQEQSTKDEQKHREGRMGASDYVKSQLLVRELERDEQVTRLEILLECMRIQSLQSLRVEAQCVRSQ